VRPRLERGGRDGGLPPRCGVCEDEELEMEEGASGKGWFCSEECVVRGAREHVLAAHPEVVREEMEMLERLEGKDGGLGMGEGGKMGEKHPDSA